MKIYKSETKKRKNENNNQRRMKGKNKRKKKGEGKKKKVRKLLFLVNHSQHNEKHSQANKLINLTRIF